MSDLAIGGLGVALLLALLVAEVPIGLGLLVVGAGGLSLLISPEAALVKAGSTAFETVLKYELGVLPLFMFMAHVCFAAGASRDFFSAASQFLGHRKGGLALASIGGSAGFGAISGSSLATVATIGTVALPEMRAAKYEPGFAAGTLAAGGTLGSLIPPSGALIVFGIIAEQSISRLFAASIIPAASQALFYLITILILCHLSPLLGPPTVRVPWRERVPALLRIIDILLLIVFVIGGLFAGWFTPTEAASVGAICSLLVLARRGRFNRASLEAAFTATLRTTGMIYTVIIGAIVFATFIAASGLTDSLVALVTQFHASPVLAICAMALALLVLGSFLDGLALMLLTTPIFLPIAEQLGYSPIWFGIFLVRTMEIGFVHPPLGLNVYVIQSIGKDIPLGKIFRGIIPYLAADFIHLAILIAFPAVTLWLPKILGS